LIKSKYQWRKQIEGIVRDGDVFDLITKNRDIQDHEAFFSMGIESIHSPWLLKDMDRVVKRIRSAIENQEKILIFGDYDCDGISSIAILYRILMQFDADVDFSIPDRFEDGYGLNMEIVKDISDIYGLVITVDNGIASVEEVDALQAMGVDVIVTDHHAFKDTLPKAYAILHTKISEDYPFKDIAGCMVAFKLAWALKGEFPQELTDLAMIGTIADLMPLEDENQAMVNIGLNQLKNTSNLGLRKILSYSDLEMINQTSIAFQIAPKINSSGRLNQAETAARLLITDDIREANDLILKIEENHVIRKRYTEKSFKIAEGLVNHDDQILVLASKDFHEGVVGICAQRIAEKYQKPTIVLKIEDDIAKGSARTFGQISILNLLKKTDDLLERYGGHTQAAGMQLNADKVIEFKNRLNQMEIDETEPVLDIDMEVALSEISKDTIQKLQNKSFHTALFLMKDLRVIRKQIIGKNHVKLLLETNHQTFEAIKFNNLEYYYNLDVNDVIDVCGGLSINKFRNKETIQIMLTDLACHHLQVLDYRRSLNTTSIEENLFKDFKVLNDETIINTPDLRALMHENRSFVLFPKLLSINFNLILDRNEMVKTYLKLKKMPYFSKFDIINTLGIHEWIGEKLIEIFSELKIIKKSKEGYQVKPQAKTDLSKSKVYQSVLEKKKTIDWLYQSTNHQIQRYLEEETHGLQ